MRNRTRRTLLTVLFLLLLAPMVRADDTYPEVTAGREVLRLIEAKDTKGLAAIAAKDNPDPWMIADWLIMEGQVEAAKMLARAVERPATAKLADYVAAGPSRKKDEVARAALAKARKVMSGGKLGDAFALLEPATVDDPNVVSVQVLFARGVSAYALRQLDTASEILKSARDHAYKVGWVTAESQILQWASQTATEREDWTAAIGLARERVMLDMELERPDRLANAFDRLAKALRDSGDPIAAIRPFTKSLALYRKADDTANTARTLMLLASAFEHAEDYPAAIEHAREGLDLLEDLGDVRGIADALIALGSFYESVAEYARSKTFLERAVRHSKENELAYFHARALAHLGVTYQALGEYPKALNSFEASLAYDSAKNNVAHIAGNLNNMAVLYDGLGDRERAIRLLRRTLAMFEQVEDPGGIASACGNLGMLLSKRGESAEGTQLVERALRIRRRLESPRGIAMALSNLGTLTADARDFPTAVRLYKEAAAIQLKSHDRAGFVQTLANLGFVLVETNQDEEALRILKNATEEVQALRSPQLELMVLASLAYAHLEAGNPALALAVAEGALKEMEHLLGGLSEEESATARSQHATIYELGALAAFRTGAADIVLKFLEAGRAGSLLESLGGRDALRFADLPESLRKAEAEALLAEAKAASRYRHAVRGGNLREQQEEAKKLSEATDQVRDVVSKIQRTAKAQAGLVYPRPASFSQIRKHLRPDQVLVVYGFSVGTAVAVVVSHDEVHARTLGSAVMLRDACLALGRVDADADVAPGLAKLRELLVTPLGLGKSVKEVLVSPAGPLCYVPFSALFDQTVAMTPSGTTHALLDTERRTPGKGVIALGDPAYAQDPSTAGAVYRGGARLTPLPASRIEVERIGDLVLVGTKASEGGLREGLATRRSWRAVHLACHGRVDRERPTLCALALTPGDEDDGFLTALEVLRMKIKADLAILSACETGAGKVVHGEGIVGLTRAFMYAGAPRVIASLWKVDDEATRALMIKFYELWNGEAALSERSESKGPKKRRLGAAEALKRAQEHVRAQKKWAHPYYWAAWVLWGLPD